jgi:hypothetical protein
VPRRHQKHSESNGLARFASLAPLNLFANRWEEGLAFCIAGIDTDNENKTLLSLRKKLEDRHEAEQKKIKDNRRKEQALDWKIAKLQRSCNERGIKVGKAKFLER